MRVDFLPSLYFSRGSIISDRILLELLGRFTLYGFMYLAFWLLLPGGISSTLDIIKSLNS